MIKRIQYLNIIPLKAIFIPLLILAYFGQGSAQSLYFPPLNADEWERIEPDSLGYCQTQIDSLYQFLEEGNTKAFIVLKNGKIVLEKYFDSFSQDSSWYWASAGKSITSFLVGLAQQDGLLDINDSTTSYLGQGWTSLDTLSESRITIRNHLTMTTGLLDDPSSLDCTEPQCLNFLTDPDQRWAYHNAPYTLLDQVLLSATDVSLNSYLYQKLALKTGITGLYIPLGYNNVLFSKPRKMARFGLLMLNNGYWDTSPILSDSEYFESMISTSQDLNLSYGYLWWLNGKSSFMLPQSQFVFSSMLTPEGPADMYSALGKNGQILNVIPSENMVVVRMGDNPDNSLVPTVFVNDMWQYINNLYCTSSTDGELVSTPTAEISPNPSSGIVNISASKQIEYVEVVNMLGQALLKEQVNNTVLTLDCSHLDPQLYYMKLSFIDGETFTQSVIIY